MSRKNQFNSELLSSQSLVADFSSPVTSIKYGDNIAYQINITTTNSTGTFQVECSMDYAVDSLTGKLINAGNWIPLVLAGGTPFANAANDQILIDLNQVPFIAVRISYTANTAGTGTCDIYVGSKAMGG